MRCASCMVVSAVSGDEVAVQSAVGHTKHAKAWLGRNDDALPQKTTEICILKRPQLLFSSHGVSTACIDNRSSLERHAAPYCALSPLHAYRDITLCNGGEDVALPAAVLSDQAVAAAGVQLEMTVL